MVVWRQVAIAALLCVGMLLLGAVGRAFGARRLPRAGAVPPGQQAVESSVLAFLGLLIAFTLSGAATRFDARKQLAIDEVNAIGTAYLRLDLLPQPDREQAQLLMLGYLDSRIAVYRHSHDVAAAFAEVAHTQALQRQLWSRALAAAQLHPSPLAIVVLPALNTMFDLAASRIAVTRIHPPSAVVALLFAVALISALLVGYALAPAQGGGWAHLVLFAVIVAVAIFVIRDLEYPRLGLIRVSDADQLLVDLRHNLVAPP